jgi:pyruvate dehydrogenase E2 component (dihydrolipoamide acetyltransferase)
MPALGMAQDTGKLVRWLVAPGERVERGQPLMEVETDKAVVEVEAPATGVLSQVSAAEGDEISVGKVIALIGDSPISEANERQPVRGDKQTQKLPRVEARPAAPLPATAAPAPAGGRAPASPKARRLAQEMDIDLSALSGTGPQSAVLASDLLGLAPEAQVPARVPETTPLWRAMAENTTRSWQNVPHFFLIREVDASGLVAARKRLAAASPEVTYTDLVVRLVAEALRKHPRMNSGQEHVNVGLAVAVEAGLIVPVLHDADQLDVAAIAVRRAALVEAARLGRMKATDLQGGTFTISNLGMYGVDLFTAIINEGQAGILALGRIADRVVAVKGRPAVRPMLALTLSCDHRAIDGARAAEFLAGLVQLFEDAAEIVG